MPTENKKIDFETRIKIADASIVLLKQRLEEIRARIARGDEAAIPLLEYEERKLATEEVELEGEERRIAAEETSAGIGEGEDSTPAKKTLDLNTLSKEELETLATGIEEQIADLETQKGLNETFLERKNKGALEGGEDDGKGGGSFKCETVDEAQSLAESIVQQYQKLGFNCKIVQNGENFTVEIEGLDEVDQNPLEMSPQELKEAKKGKDKDRTTSGSRYDVVDFALGSLDLYLQYERFNWANRLLQPDGLDLGVEIGDVVQGTVSAIRGTMESAVLEGVSPVVGESAAVVAEAASAVREGVSAVVSGDIPGASVAPETVEHLASGIGAVAQNAGTLGTMMRGTLSSAGRLVGGAINEMTRF